MAGADYIDFKTMTGFTREMVLSQIDDMIAIAGGYGGVVFGGYVRDVLVPRRFDPKCDVQFKDVDLWFTTEKDQKAFLAKMGGRLQIVPNFPDKSKPNLYKFERQQYNLFSHGTCVAWVDLVVSRTFPVNDFDVNCLTYLKTGTVGQFGSRSGVLIDELVRRLQAGEVQILSGYAMILCEETQTGYIHQLRVVERYIKRGWKVFYDGVQYTGSTHPVEFPRWIQAQVRAETDRIRGPTPVPPTPVPSSSTPAMLTTSTRGFSLTTPTTLTHTTSTPALGITTSPSTASTPIPASSSSTPAASISTPAASSSTPAASIPTSPAASSSTPASSSSTPAASSPAPIAESIASMFGMAVKMLGHMGIEPPSGMKMPSETNVADAISSIFDNPANQNAIQELFSGSQSNDETIATAVRIVTDTLNGPAPASSSTKALVASTPEPVAQIESAPISNFSELPIFCSHRPRSEIFKNPLPPCPQCIVSETPILPVPIASSSEASVAKSSEPAQISEKTIRREAALNEFEDNLKKMRQNFVALLDSQL